MSTTGIVVALAALVASAFTAMFLRVRYGRLSREAHAAARALRDSDRLRMVLWEQRKDGVLVWNSAGRIIQASDRAASLFGLPPAGIVGRQIDELMACEGDGRYVLPDLTDGGDGERVVLVRARRQGDDAFPLELRVRPLDVSGGRQWVGLCRDASGDADAEAERRRSESIRMLVDVLPDAVVIHRAGLLVYVNRRVLDLLGYDRAEELVGRSPLVLVHPDDHLLARERMRRGGAGGRPQPLTEERLVRRDGSILSMDVLAVPIVFEGEPATLAMARDSSERHRLQARGALADRMASVGRLAAGVAHGINNPLSYVLANTEFALEEIPRFPFEEGKAPPVVEDVTRALAQAREGAHRIRDLVSDLATFSRSGERGSEPAALDRVLESTLSLAANEIRHRARLVKDFGPTPAVLADESRLAHAFMNLLMNAAYAIPEGDAEHHEIRVSTRTDESGRALVEIRDTGAGIAPELVGNVFDPFFTTRPVGEASGLGLSISYEIVASLGGSIQAESEVGRGSVFRVTLPTVQSGQRGSARSADGARRLRVLVVDDEPLVLETCERLLEPTYEVRTAESGRAALERIQAGEPFDVIVCDLLMPDVTGMELYTLLRGSHPRLADRMIFVTGGAFTPRAQAFLETVPNLRLEKPFDRDGFLGVVQECLSR